MSDDDSREPESARISRERRRERRRSDGAASQDGEPAEPVRSVSGNPLGEVRFDDRGNAIWEWRVDVPRRREEDDTIDLLECLDPADLSLADDEDEPGPAGSGFNPYDKG